MLFRSAPKPRSSQPWLHQSGEEIQEFGTVRQFPVGLSYDTRMYSCQRLNQVLCDTRILHDLYKKHHWLMRGHTFYQLHLLFDEHAKAQYELVDKISERIQQLGGIALGDPRHVAEHTSIERPADGAEAPPVLMSRLLEAHEAIIVKAREVAAAVEDEDRTTDDLLSSEVLPVNELQVWFVAEHLVEVPLVDA